MEPIIRINELRKHFKVNKHHKGFWGAWRNLVTWEYTLVHAVDGISFAIQPGELVGYLGPNGAGKSTTIKMLTGLLVPTSGTILIDGMIPWKMRRRYVAEIGAVFGWRTTLWWDLPVIESLEMFRYIYRVPPDRFSQNMKAFQEMLGLDEFVHTPVRSLSLGQRVRADICAALLHDPKLLFLDEPTIGLDVVAKERIRMFIKKMNRERGITVILTTHDLSDVEKLCERVMIIDKGKLLFNGQLSDINERFGGERKLVVDLAEDYQEINIEGARVHSREGMRVTFAFERGTITASELIARLSSRYRIQDLEVQEPEIEDTIRRIYEEGLLYGG